MSIKKIAATFVLVVAVMPFAASAQSISLSLQARQELVSLATQLVQILAGISQAQALGTAYTNSPAFAQVGLQWVTQMAQIQQRVSAILSSAATMPTYPTYPTYPTTPYPGSSTCPNLFRDLEPGMQGNDVVELQRFLTSQSALQYQEQATGSFSPATLFAVQRFQSLYGIQSYGDWNTTGYGRVGPATRATLARVCAQVVYTNPTPTPTAAAESSGSVTVTYPTGQAANTAQFTVVGNPTSSCAQTTFTLFFGDGQQHVFNFPASCSTSTQVISHSYPSASSYSAQLKSGNFQTSVSVNVAPSNHTLSLSAIQGSVSYSTDVTLTFNPGTRCMAQSYTLKWGDGSDRTVNFSDSCSVQTKTYSHTYSESGTYTIQSIDSSGNTTGINFAASVIASAGVGDPYSVLELKAEGANGSASLTDTSRSARSVSVQGNTHIETGAAAVGSGAIDFDGSGDYVSVSNHSDFNFGTGPFTVNFWLKTYTFPAASAQSGLIVQANSSATDSSLGGAGLILFGDKVYFVGRIGSTTYHPFYGNSIGTRSLVGSSWYHIALVRSGNTVTLYLDGVAQGSLTVVGSANASTNSLSIGRYGEYSGNYFDGWMDQIDIAKGVARWFGNFDAFTGTNVASTTSVTSPNRVYTNSITPSDRVLGTHDDFRYGSGISLEQSADQICQLAGKTAAQRPISYSCAPAGSQTESRHNYSWGYYNQTGQGWCEATGVLWVDCI